MGWILVKQPNNLIGRFSTIIDNFTNVNMTAERAFTLCRVEYDMDKPDAKEKVKGAVEDWKPSTFGLKGSGHDRWDDCMESVKRVHGEAGAKKLLDDVTSGAQDMKR